MKDTKKEAKRIYEEIQGGVKEVLNGIRNFIEEGSARRLIIKQGRRSGFSNPTCLWSRWSSFGWSHGTRGFCYWNVCHVYQ